MNEQAFTYDHFNNASYLFVAIGLSYIPIIMIPVITVPMMVTYWIAWLVFFTYSMTRFVSFTRRHKSLTRKKYSEIIKRHRYSLKWGFIVIPVSIFLCFICERIVGMNYLQIIGTFGLMSMLMSFIGIRVFLRNLNHDMNTVP